MEYVARTVRSKPGLSQEDALVALQEHPQFKVGTVIKSIRRRNNRFVAELLEPKMAGGFPPSDDSGSEEESAPPSDDTGEESSDSSSDDSGSDDSSSDATPDGGPDFGGGEEKGEGGEKGEIKHLMSLVQQIADALGIAPDLGPDMAGPDGIGPGPAGPGAPPPGGPDDLGAPPHGGHGGLPGSADKAPGQLPTKLKPGETLPHQTPVGAPAFASTRQANPVAPPLNPMIAPNAPVPAGNPMLPGGDQSPEELLRQQQMMGQGQPGIAGPPAAPVGPVPPVMAKQRVASFTASKHDPQSGISIREAKANLEATYPGYKVKQITRDGQHIRALLSVR